MQHLYYIFEEITALFSTLLPTPHHHQLINAPLGTEEGIVSFKRGLHST